MKTARHPSQLNLVALLFLFAATPAMAKKLTREEIEDGPLDLSLAESEGRDPRGLPPLGLGWKLNTPLATPANHEQTNELGFALLAALWRTDKDVHPAALRAAPAATKDGTKDVVAADISATPNTTPYYPVLGRVPYSEALTSSHAYATIYRKIYAQQQGLLAAVGVDNALPFAVLHDLSPRTLHNADGNDAPRSDASWSAVANVAVLAWGDLAAYVLCARVAAVFALRCFQR